MPNQTLHLLRPKVITLLRPSQNNKRSYLALAFFAGLGLLFWWGIYAGSAWLCRQCLGVEDIGELLLQKILSMAFLTFFSILVFSNLVSSFSQFFLSDDLQLLGSVPIRPLHLFGARLLETMFSSSWMVLIFSLPFLLAYGRTFGAGWRFYLQIFVVMVPFLLIPAALAVLFALLLASAFPARRMRDLLLFLFVLGFAGLYLYFRLLEPERFLDPEQFTEAIHLLGMLRNPTSAYLPSDWVVASLFPFLSQKGMVFQPMYLAALYTTAGSCLIVTFWVFEWLYTDAFSKAQAGRKLRVQASRALDGVLDLVTRPFAIPTRVMFGKEMKTFLRNPGQWAQLLLLGALIVVYVFNFRNLRQLSEVRLGGIPAYFADLGLYMFNLGLLGFVITAVVVRFAYPSVSLEGKAFWMIRQAPISMGSFLVAKFWSIFLPLAFLSEMICIITNLFIRASLLHFVLAVVSVLLMTIALTGMGVGLGAMYPRFEEDNPAKIAAGFGGVLYMILSVFWIVLLLVLEFLPLRVLLWHQLRKTPWTQMQVGVIILCAALITLVTWLTYKIPMHFGTKALSKTR